MKKLGARPQCFCLDFNLQTYDSTKIYLISLLISLCPLATICCTNIKLLSAFVSSASLSLPHSTPSLVCRLFSADTFSQLPLLSPPSQSFNTCKNYLNFNRDNLSIFLYYSSQIYLPIGNANILS